MKNRPADLNNHLFAMLEELADEELTGEDLDRKCRRANSMAKVAKVIVDNYRTSIDAQKMIQDRQVKLPDFLEDKSVQKEDEDHPKFLLRREA